MPTNIDDAAIGAKHDPSLALPPDEKHQGDPSAHATGLPLVYEGAPTEVPHRQHGRDPTNYYDNDAGEWPTEEELHTLRRVADRIPWKAFALAFVELCERFSYYGTTVVFTNFIQQPLPKGSHTGAGHDGQSGALDFKQRASTGIGTFNQFWVYLLPLFGAYVADTYLGRYKTICWALGIAIIGHIILVVQVIFFL